MNESPDLVPVPIPSLVAILLNRDRAKGSPLTEVEVLEIRGQCNCIMMPIGIVVKLEESRGYKDLDLDNAWLEWCQIRPSLYSDHE